MPSLNRPNAPDRLPSCDFGNLFGRPRAVRGSDLTSANSSPSPLSTPNNYIAAQRRALRSSEGGNAHPATTSPLASPPLSVVRQRPKLERRGYYSDVIVVSPDKTNNIFSPSNEVPLIIEEDPVLIKDRTASESSSAKSRARRLLGLPGNRITYGPVSEQPPSKARSGFKWKHEFSGRWLEIRIGRKGQSAEHSAQASGEATPMPLSHSSSMHLPLSQATTVLDPERGDRSSNVASDQRLLLPESQIPSQSATLTPREGLGHRTRRALGLKHNPTNPTHPSDPRERTSTDALLDRVSSTLRFLPKRKTPSPNSTIRSSSNLSIATLRWQRMMQHHHEDSTSTDPSTSSSIRGVMMGKPPIPTPEPEAMYTASDDNKYMAVDLTDGKTNGGITFLPSEARRVHTPPLPSADASATSPGRKAVRGFFFDYSAPTLPERPPPSAADVSNVNVSVGGGSDGGAAGGAQQQRRRDSDWYRVKMNAIIDAEDSTVMSMEELAVSVPEHLPNSPLCPRHPKHKSWGRGECPFHGRNPTALFAKEMERKGQGLSPQGSPGEHWW